MIAKAGRSVLILEARDRVGGKVLNQSIGHGEITEAGATYIGPTQDRMASLALEYKIGTYPTWDQGDSVTIINGNRVVGGFDPALQSEYAALVASLNEMAATIPVSDPTAAANAAEWDSQTLYSWLESQGASSGALEAFGSVADLWGAEPRDVSLLFALYYIAAAGDAATPGTLQRLLDITGGAQELRFEGGSQVLAEAIAAELGQRVSLGVPVREINWSGNGVMVTTDKRTLRARQVILAMAPALAAGIRFEPKLPTPRAQFLQRLPMGSLVKVEAVYAQPFWRTAGLSGQSVNGSGPVRSTFDNTPAAPSRHSHWLCRREQRTELVAVASIRAARQRAGQFRGDFKQR